MIIIININNIVSRMEEGKSAFKIMCIVMKTEIYSLKIEII